MSIIPYLETPAQLERHKLQVEAELKSKEANELLMEIDNLIQLETKAVKLRNKLTSKIQQQQNKDFIIDSLSKLNNSGELNCQISSLSIMLRDEQSKSLNMQEDIARLKKEFAKKTKEHDVIKDKLAEKTKDTHSEITTLKHLLSSLTQKYEQEQNSSCELLIKNGKLHKELKESKRIGLICCIVTIIITILFIALS